MEIVTVRKDITKVMKPAILVVTAVLVLPVGAEEKTTAAAAPAPAAAAPQQQDSPLVAAAKRAKRLGKKPSNVITNETLRQSGAGAHVTTTASQKGFQPPPALAPLRPTPEMEAAAGRIAHEKELAEQAKLQKKAAEAQRRGLARASEGAEDEYYSEGEDPAQAERAADEAATGQKPPQG
jgi:hypothetical protein